jgi:hypothetical protein
MTTDYEVCMRRQARRDAQCKAIAIDLVEAAATLLARNHEDTAQALLAQLEDIR